MNVQKRVKPSYYMNTLTRAVYCAKPQHVDNPTMVPYYGELPPMHPVLGLRVVPRENLGPEFAHLTDDVVRPPKLNEEEEAEKKKAAEKEAMGDEPVLKIAEAIGELKRFDFTSAGLPKVDALSLVLGFPVSGPQRDEAYALYLENKKIVGE